MQLTNIKYQLLKDLANNIDSFGGNMKKTIVRLGIVLGALGAIAPYVHAGSIKNMTLIAGERRVTVSKDDCDEIKRKLRRNIVQQESLDKKIKELKAYVTETGQDISNIKIRINGLENAAVQLVNKKGLETLEPKVGEDIVEDIVKKEQKHIEELTAKQLFFRISVPRLIFLYNVYDAYSTIKKIRNEIYIPLGHINKDIDNNKKTLEKYKKKVDEAKKKSR